MNPIDTDTRELLQEVLRERNSAQAEESQTSRRLDQLLDRLDASDGSLPATKLKEPSIWQRFLARGVNMFDDAARMKWLQERGLNPREKGFTLNPLNREFWADIAESSPPWIRAGAETAGASAGIAAASPTGLTPIGFPSMVAAGMLGSAAGANLTQTAFDALAGEKPNLIKGMLVAGSGATDFLTQKALGNVPAVAKGGLQKLGGTAVRLTKKTPLGEFVLKQLEGAPDVIKQHLLQRLAQFQKGMIDFLDKEPFGWRKIVSTFKSAGLHLESITTNKIIPAINEFRFGAGKTFEQATRGVINNPDNVIDFTSAFSKVNKILSDFASSAKRLTPGEEKEIKSMFRGFFGRVGGIKKDTKALSTKLMPENEYVLYNKDKTLRWVYDQFRNIEDAIGTKWTAAGSADQKTETFVGAVKAIKKTLKEHLHRVYPQISKADRVYESMLDTWEDSMRYFGNRDKALSFLQTHIFDDGAEGVAGRRAFDFIDERSRPNLKYGHLARLFTAAEIAKAEKIRPAGFHFEMLPRLAQAAGAVAGGTAGGLLFPENAVVSAAAGGTLGGIVGRRGTELAQYPFAIPSVAARTMALSQKVKPWLASELPKIAQKGRELYEKPITKLLTYKIVSSPMYKAIENISNNFGLEVLDTDLNKLRSSKIK